MLCVCPVGNRELSHCRSCWGGLCGWEESLRASVWEKKWFSDQEDPAWGLLLGTLLNHRGWYTRQATVTAGLVQGLSKRQVCGLALPLSPKMDHSEFSSL